jgi:hypothetical protein
MRPEAEQKMARVRFEFTRLEGDYPVFFWPTRLESAHEYPCTDAA